MCCLTTITTIITRPGVAQWLRLFPTSRTVPGSITGGVTGFFSDIFPSDRTMALEATQPLVKMSTRNIPGVEAAGACVWPHHLHVPNVITSGRLNLVEHSGPHRTCYGSPLPLTIVITATYENGAGEGIRTAQIKNTPCKMKVRPTRCKQHPRHSARISLPDSPAS
jgi:hypothetical protein